RAVEFFGAQARFPQGPVKLAALSGSYLIPSFIPMCGYKKYDVIVGDPMEFADNDDVKYCLSRVARIFEKYIALYPVQWYMFMPFWDEDRKRMGFEA
ncbi:MAG: hypothetical protein GWN97_05800, partial [Thermoplasmata archaeon]|nr:hypothetical protein [Thermoplasmata archaeon]